MNGGKNMPHRGKEILTDEGAASKRNHSPAFHFPEQDLSIRRAALVLLTVYHELHVFLV